jgi:protein involved in polysaccharide export with SLBB domain
MATTNLSWSTRFSAIVLLGYLSGCATLQTASSNVAVVPGDDLYIVFTSEPYSVGFRRKINMTGELDLPLNVKLHVAGMTLRQVEHAISDRYPNCYNASRQIVVSKHRNNVRDLESKVWAF